MTSNNKTLADIINQNKNNTTVVLNNTPQNTVTTAWSEALKSTATPNTSISSQLSDLHKLNSKVVSTNKALSNENYSDKSAIKTVNSNLKEAATTVGKVDNTQIFSLDKSLTDLSNYLGNLAVSSGKVNNTQLIDTAKELSDKTKSIINSAGTVKNSQMYDLSQGVSKLNSDLQQYAVDLGKTDNTSVIDLNKKISDIDAAGRNLVSTTGQTKYNQMINLANTLKDLNKAAKDVVLDIGKTDYNQAIDLQKYLPSSSNAVQNTAQELSKIDYNKTPSIKNEGSSVVPDTLNTFKNVLDGNIVNLSELSRQVSNTYTNSGTKDYPELNNNLSNLIINSDNLLSSFDNKKDTTTNNIDTNSINSAILGSDYNANTFGLNTDATISYNPDTSYTYSSNPNVATTNEDKKDETTTDPNVAQMEVIHATATKSRDSGTYGQKVGMYDHYFTASDCTIFLSYPLYGRKIQVDKAIGVGWNEGVSSNPIYTLGNSNPEFFSKGNSLVQGSIDLAFKSTEYMMKAYNYLAGSEALEESSEDINSKDKLDGYEDFAKFNAIQEARSRDARTPSLSNMDLLLNIEINFNNQTEFSESYSSSSITIAGVKFIASGTSIHSGNEQALTYRYSFMAKNVE